MFLGLGTSGATRRTRERERGPRYTKVGRKSEVGPGRDPHGTRKPLGCRHVLKKASFCPRPCESATEGDSCVIQVVRDDLKVMSFDLGHGDSTQTIFCGQVACRFWSWVRPRNSSPTPLRVSSLKPYG